MRIASAPTLATARNATVNGIPDGSEIPTRVPLPTPAATSCRASNAERSDASWKESLSTSVTTKSAPPCSVAAHSRSLGTVAGNPRGGAPDVLIRSATAFARDSPNSRSSSRQDARKRVGARLRDLAVELLREAADADRAEHLAVVGQDRNRTLEACDAGKPDQTQHPSSTRFVSSRFDGPGNR